MLARRRWGSIAILYNTVGADYVWWLRRTLPDRELAGLLADPAVTIHTLYGDGEPAGFFELDARHWPEINLGYFGLMPHAVGGGIGHAFLRRAVDEVMAARRPRHDGKHLQRRPSTRAADLPARRVPHRPPGAGGVECAKPSRPTDPAQPQALSPAPERVASIWPITGSPPCGIPLPAVPWGTKWKVAGRRRR